jgi:nucleotide-binding universal stress UspA family protein
MKKILCPIDFSTASQAAMRTAERLATALGGEMVLLHATGLVDDDKERLALEGVEALREMHAFRLKSSGIISETVVHPGPPGEVICWFAEHGQCDLIVMGTHGRTGLSHLFLGSVAEYVVRHARCPVMTVRLQPAGQPPLTEPLGHPVPAPRFM